MTDTQTIAYNREACERVLVRAHRPAPVGLVTLDRSMLCGTAFEVLEALVWLSKRVESLEAKCD